MRCFILGFALGVGLLQLQPALPSADAVLWLAAGSCGGLLLACFVRRGRQSAASGNAARRMLALVLMPLVMLLAGGTGGFGYAAYVAERRLADALPAQWEGLDIRVTGIVSGLPAVNITDRSVRFAFDVETIETQDAIVPSRVALSWYTTWRGARDTKKSDDSVEEPLPELHAGERWTLSVRLRRPHGNSNPHGFDLEAWMLENGLRASGYVRKDDGNRRLAAFSGRPLDAVDALRERIRERIQST